MPVVEFSCNEYKQWKQSNRERTTIDAFLEENPCPNCEKPTEENKPYFRVGYQNKNETTLICKLGYFDNSQSFICKLIGGESSWESEADAAGNTIKVEDFDCKKNACWDFIGETETYNTSLLDVSSEEPILNAECKLGWDFKSKNYTCDSGSTPATWKEVGGASLFRDFECNKTANYCPEISSTHNYRATVTKGGEITSELTLECIGGSEFMFTCGEINQTNGGWFDSQGMVMNELPCPETGIMHYNRNAFLETEDGFVCKAKAGYTGESCTQCLDGFYKEELVCKKCSNVTGIGNNSSFIVVSFVICLLIGITILMTGRYIIIYVTVLILSSHVIHFINVIAESSAFGQYTLYFTMFTLEIDYLKASCSFGFFNKVVYSFGIRIAYIVAAYIVFIIPGVVYHIFVSSVDLKASMRKIMELTVFFNCWAYVSIGSIFSEYSMALKKSGYVDKIYFGYSDETSHKWLKYTSLVAFILHAALVPILTTVAMFYTAKDPKTKELEAGTKNNHPEPEYIHRRLCPVFFAFFLPGIALILKPFVWKSVGIYSVIVIYMAHVAIIMVAAIKPFKKDILNSYFLIIVEIELLLLLVTAFVCYKKFPYMNEKNVETFWLLIAGAGILLCEIIMTIILLFTSLKKKSGLCNLSKIQED